MSENCALVELESATAVAPVPASVEEVSIELLRANYELLFALHDEEEDEDDDDWDEDDDDDFDDDDLDDDDLDDDDEEEEVDEP